MPAKAMKEGVLASFSFIEPMQALQVAKLPEGDWLYEVKLDGYRALAFKDGKEVRLISRNNKPLNYPGLLDSLKLLALEQVVLDGEIVALDEKGRSSFQLLQVYKSSKQCVPLVYYVFDLGERRRAIAEAQTSDLPFYQSAREKPRQMGPRDHACGFTEWTLDNQLRQPVFLGLRTDKEANDVVRE